MPTISSQDASLTFEMTLSDTRLSNQDSPVISIYSVMNALHQASPISTIVYSTGTAMVTLKDGRVFATTVNPGPPPAFRMTSQNFWTVDEISYLRAIHNVLFPLVAVNGMSALMVTYA